MNRYRSVEVPDYVPDQWRQRYGGAHSDDGAEASVDDEVRAQATVIRLLIWLGTVTAIAAAMMWPAIRVPRLLAVLAFLALGAAAGLVFARWVRDTPDRRPAGTARATVGAAEGGARRTS
jgi:hypothetical protein